MRYVAEFAGSLVLLLCGYGYMCNVSLKKTLVTALNYVELVIAWSLSVGLGLTTSIVMGGPAYLNPGVVLGNVIAGTLPVLEALLFLLMEFLAAGAAVVLCMVFFWDSFQATPNAPKRGIFSAYPVERNLVQNFVQEIMATFVFLFIMLTCLKAAGGEFRAFQTGVIGAAVVAVLALSLNSTGYSMNAMRSVFSSVWFELLPIPNKNGERVDWPYQLTVNLLGSSIGGILGVLVTGLF